MVRRYNPAILAQVLLLTFILAMAGQAQGAEGTDQKNPHITLQVSAASAWTLTYSLTEPVKKLVFMRNPDNSRVERWQPLDQEFVLKSTDGGEQIERKDGLRFTQVTFGLTPTYKHLPKEYAPFAPFSDGAHLTHSGRYFACAESCDDAPNQWSFKVIAPDGYHVIAKGQKHPNIAKFTDKDSGTNIYVGEQTPVESSSFISVIDHKLPDNLKEALTTQLPKLMHYFADNLGQTNGPKPMLFASYANKPGGSTQGGTFANQIFMHWDRNDLEEKAKSPAFIHQTLWFFAHEAAHFFQKSQSHSLFGEQEHSWLHEGGAEWLAAKALRNLYPEIESYITTKTQSHDKHCRQGTTDIALKDAAKNGQFMLYYSCGFFIHEYLAKEIHKASEGEENAFNLWLEFAKHVDEGSEINAETFWQATEKWLSSEQIAHLKHSIAEKNKVADDFLASLKPMGAPR